MQVIQIMHGIQISPMTVKVSWAKLFPEDTHDDSGEAGSHSSLANTALSFIEASFQPTMANSRRTRQRYFP